MATRGVTKANGGWVLAATILASSMAFIDGTAVNVALPALQTSLHATAQQVQWVVEAYALFVAALLLVGGSLGDHYGRRLVFLVGVGLFTVGSVWCGVAPGVGMLIAARSLQGIGAALLTPGSLALISASFAEEKRGAAIGTWSGFSAMTTAVGPVLGGWLVEHASWRWVFFLNVPFAVAVIAISLWRVPESSSAAAQKQRLDWPGAALATVGLGAVTFALIEFQRGGAVVWSAAVLGAVMLGCFVWREAVAKAPMVPFRIFASRTFSGANLLTFFLYAAMGGLLVFLPLNLVDVQGYSATEAGASLLPVVLLIFTMSRWAGGLIARFGARLPLTVGPLIAASGFAMFARPEIGGSYWTTWFPAACLLGLGMAVSVAPLTTAVMNALPVDDAGVASGVNNAVSRVASLLAVALFGVVLVTVFSHALVQGLANVEMSDNARKALLAQSSRLAAIATDDAAAKKVIAEAFVAGFRRVAWMACAFAVVAAVCAQRIEGRVARER